MSLRSLFRQKLTFVERSPHDGEYYVWSHWDGRSDSVPQCTLGFKKKSQAQAEAKRQERTLRNGLAAPPGTRGGT